VDWLGQSCTLSVSQLRAQIGQSQTAFPLSGLSASGQAVEAVVEAMVTTQVLVVEEGQWRGRVSLPTLLNPLWL